MVKQVLLAAALLFSQLINAQIEINTSGNIGIGIIPNSSYKLYVNGYTYLNNSVGIGTYATPNSSYKLGVSGPVNVNCGAHSASLIFKWNSNGFASLYPSANNQGYIGRSDFAFIAMYAYDFVELSDSRQKENFRNIETPLKTILKLKGLKYDIKKEYSANIDSIKDNKIKEKIEKQRLEHIGFLAQDVEKVLPEVVHYDDSTDVYAISYSKIIPVLVEAMKEQQVLIEDLQRQVKEFSKKGSK